MKRHAITAGVLGTAALVAAAATVAAAPPARKAAQPAGAKTVGQFTQAGEKTALRFAYARWEKRQDALGIGVLLTEKRLAPAVAASFAKGDDISDVFTPIVESWSGGLHLHVTPEGKVVWFVAKRPGLFTGSSSPDVGGVVDQFKLDGGRVSGAVKAPLPSGRGGDGEFAATFDAALPPRPAP
jgi:hypothetical protein